MIKPDKSSFIALLDYIKSLYPGINPVPLHAPVFRGNEKKHMQDCIDTTFVSYLGKYVTQFEEMTAQYTGAKYAIAMVNGTTALQIALKIAGVEPGDEVITQALTFVATANAISHAGAEPVFVDVDKTTLGMSPEHLNTWMRENIIYDQARGRSVNRKTKKPISAIVPMHTFGHPCQIEEIVEIANTYSIPVVEDSAESLGSYYKGQHTGTYGLAGVFSYNGNKTITTGGGGMIVTDDEKFATRARHITTTAKLPHRWEYDHDEIGYNYRLTNVNAAIGVAQMEQVEQILKNKRDTAIAYQTFFRNQGFLHVWEPRDAISNFWLNAILLRNRKQRDEFLEFSNENQVVTRPVWQLMNHLEMYQNCQSDDLENSEWLAARVVNLPSSVRLK
jgi:perosamine synthetase